MLVKLTNSLSDFHMASCTILPKPFTQKIGSVPFCTPPKKVFRYASARSSQPRQTSTHAEKPEYCSSSGSVRAMALFGLPQAG